MQNSLQLRLVKGQDELKLDTKGPREMIGVLMAIVSR